MDFLNFFNSDQIIENILKIIHCPFCSGPYSEESVSIVARFDTNYVAHLLCDHCGSGIMAGFSYSQKDKKTAGRIGKIDVKLDEMMKFATQGQINDEDMLNFYQGIKAFDGNFKKIFRVRRTKNHQ